MSIPSKSTTSEALGHRVSAMLSGGGGGGGVGRSAFQQHEPKRLINYMDDRGNTFTVGILCLPDSHQPLVVFTLDHDGGGLGSSDDERDVRGAGPGSSSSSTGGGRGGGMDLDDVVIGLGDGGEAALGLYEAIRRLIVHVVTPTTTTTTSSSAEAEGGSGGTSRPSTPLARPSVHRTPMSGAILSCPLDGDFDEDGAVEDPEAAEIDEAMYPIFLPSGCPEKEEMEGLLRSLHQLAKGAHAKRLARKKAAATPVGTTSSTTAGATAGGSSSSTYRRAPPDVSLMRPAFRPSATSSSAAAAGSSAAPR